MRESIDCAPCLVEAGQRWPQKWTPIQFGPYSRGRCDWCGKHGDESTMDPLSGDGQGCFDCAEKYQRGDAYGR